MKLIRLFKKQESFSNIPRPSPAIFMYIWIPFHIRRYISNICIIQYINKGGGNMKSDEQYMHYAILNAEHAVNQKTGGPFGAIVVDEDGSVVGSGYNTVLSKNHDVTAHAEINAIRDACSRMGTHDLSGCTIYITAHPCPMCMGAIRWSNISAIKYGCSTSESEQIGFRDKKFYESSDGAIQIEQISHDMCLELFKTYQKSEHTLY